MFSAEKFDVSTLNWVKVEIDETLKQARIALEAYVENSDDQTQLQSCISYLHQVAGTLQMVELQGSAQFASEAEQVAIALEKGEVSDREHGYEVLMRAILQLPDYLESLLGGAGDNPIVLLPLLNELRDSRGEKPLSEAIFFNPDLTVMPRAAAQPSRIDVKTAAHKLRPYYQAALLKTLRGEDSGQLKVLGTVLEKLYSVVVRPQTRQWLWVACGFTEGLRDGGIELNNPHKQLLGKIDQLLKQIVESGEAGVKSEHMAVLIRTMLFQVAKSSTNGPLISELRESFHLDSLVPASVQSGQSLLGGFNAELKRTVSADILEELARVKETFDIFVRSDHRDVASLTGIADSLGTMAETLVLLRQDTLSDELRAQSSVLHRIVRGDVAPEDGTLMGVASTILSVESTLGDWGNTTPVEKADDITGQVSVDEVGLLAEAEHARVVRQVMKEARDGVI
jgi:chemosensory pili system protein ChpA (sensor histidine kinase/response regulator)